MATPADQFDPEVVFLEAKAEFLASLQPREVKAFATYTQCTSGEELLEHVQSLPALSNNPSLLRRAVAKVKGLSDILTPYFETVSIIISSNPEFAALAWGAFRLVLQLASNFSTFFDKLTGTLEQIGSELPRYRFLLNILQSKYKQSNRRTDELWQIRLRQSMLLSVRIKRSICVLYQDILRFLLAVLRVFTKKDGSSRSSILVASSLFWRPYDLRFKDFIDQLATHQSLLEGEIQCLRAYKADEMEEILNQEAYSLAAERVRVRIVEKATEEQLQASEKINYATLKALKLSVLKTWLDAPRFADDLEKALETREPGTADWLFSEEIFSTWQKSNTRPSLPLQSSHGWLWIHGNPGCGKTVMAASLVEFIRDTSNNDCLCYFFFRAGTSRFERPIDAFSSILAQTLQHHRNNEELMDKFIFAMDESGSGQPQASKNELWDLVRICVEGRFIRFMVLDGIDECVQGEELVSDLFQAFEQASALASLELDEKKPPTTGRPDAAMLPTKVVLFSRPHLTSLSRLFPDNQLAVRHLTCPDINLFLTRNIQSLRNRRLLPTGLNVSETVSRLAKRADGMFLWARLMTNYLSSPVLNTKKRLDEINNAVKPEGIDIMYDRIINLLLLQNAEEKKFVQWILMWLASSMRELSARELHETLKTMDPDMDLADVIEYENFGDAVIIMCSSLVEKVDRNSSGDGDTASVTTSVDVSYRLIHLSAKEYLISFSSDPIRALMGTKEQLALTISRSCLLYLFKHMPRATADAENSRTPLSAELIQRVSALYPYITEFWVAHLPTCLFHLSEGLTDLYSSFLSTASNFMSGRLSLLSFIEGLYMLVKCRDERQDIIDRLEKWGRQGLPRISSSDVSSDAVHRGILQLSEYLRKLESDWSSQLLAIPALIWDEVLTHNPCPLIPTTSSSAVYSLTPMADDRFREYLSTNCLFKISETINEHCLLAVLSIWPSRTYESLLANRGDDAYSSQKLKDACKGWAALFELYDTSNAPCRVLERWIRLNDTEVWIQHCHSLSDQNVQFPVSISPCGHKFSILRDVFAIRLNRDETSYKNAQVARIRLSLAGDECFEGLWSEWYAGGVNTTTTRSWDVSHSLYHYWLSFNQTGTMMVFTDRTAKKNSHRHLAVFHVALHHDIEICLASPPRTYNHWESKPITASRQCFHPQRSLLAFTVAGTAFVWDYGDTRGGSNLILRPYHTGPRGFTGELWVYTQFSTYEGVGFSKCGGHLVLEEYVPNGRSSRFPTVAQIPSHILGHCGPIPTTEAQYSEEFTTRRTISRASPHTSLVAQNRAGSASAIVDQYGNVNSTSVTAGSGVVRMNLGSQTEGAHSQADVELTRVPDSWGNLDQTNVTVQVPEARNDTLQIIINRPSRLHYSMAGDSDLHLPAVVERPIESMARRVHLTEFGDQMRLTNKHENEDK